MRRFSILGLLCLALVFPLLANAGVPDPDCKDDGCVMLGQSTCETGCEGGTCEVYGENACCCNAGAPELSPKSFIPAVLLLLGGALLIAYRRSSRARRHSP